MSLALDLPIIKTPSWKSADEEYQYVLSCLKQSLQKSEQLDTDADRRVLLIVNRCWFAEDYLTEAVAEILPVISQMQSNIDEVFVEVKENDFKQVYLDEGAGSS